MSQDTLNMLHAMAWMMLLTAGLTATQFVMLLTVIWKLDRLSQKKEEKCENEP